MKKQFNLTRRLVLQQVVLNEDLTGGFEKNWVDLGVVWASVDARSGQIRETRSGELSRLRYRIITRASIYGSSGRPSAGQRFKEGERIYDIEAVAVADGAGLYLECWASEEQLT